MKKIFKTKSKTLYLLLSGILVMALGLVAIDTINAATKKPAKPPVKKPVKQPAKPPVKPQPKPPVQPQPKPPVQPVPTQPEIKFNPPSFAELKDDVMGKSIKLGYQLFNESDKYLTQYIGNKLSCSSCHGDGGRDKAVAPLVGTAAQFPQYRPREGVVFSLEDRINGCMKRSMNGIPLPYDSVELKAMNSYITWLSKGIPMGIEILPWGKLQDIKTATQGNPENGKKLYDEKCAMCHGINGEGIGANTGPAVWGPDSFNNGAGLARVTKLAAYIKATMPTGSGQGKLSDSEASDMAKYILSHERPIYKDGDKDWPNGGKPGDVPY